MDSQVYVEIMLSGGHVVKGEITESSFLSLSDALTHDSWGGTIHGATTINEGNAKAIALWSEIVAIRYDHTGSETANE